MIIAAQWGGGDGALWGFATLEWVVSWQLYKGHRHFRFIFVKSQKRTCFFLIVYRTKKLFSVVFVKFIWFSIDVRYIVYVIYSGMIN